MKRDGVRVKGEWSRRDLFKGVLASGVVAGGLAWSSPWRLHVPEPVFERDVRFTLPANESSWTWRWLVLPPSGPAIELEHGEGQGGESLNLALNYPFRGISHHGSYRYWLEFDHPGQGMTQSAPVVLELRPYRFGC